MPNYRAHWGNAAAWTAAAAITITLLFTGFEGRSFWLRLLEQGAANIIFSGICATLCVLVIPKVAERTCDLAAPLRWAIIVAVLVVLGTIGSLLAMAVAVVIQIVPLNRFFAEWYPNSLRMSVYFTVIFGIAGTVIEQLRSRLSDTRLALRTKERDEAEARRLVAEAQLASLESRVDPHFLFNTLNSIAALVRDKPADAERVVEQLSALMRSSLDRQAPLVTLQEELAVVRAYLDIERVRFGDRLRYHIDIDHGLGSTLVPRLSLQTLVENSVKYAISPRRDGGSITVRAAANNGHLRLEIGDDGPGFDPSSLPEGHGLALLRSRLALLYGDRGSLDIHGAPSATSVVMQVPS